MYSSVKNGKTIFAKIPRELYKHLLPTARHSLVSHCMLPYPLIFRIHSLLNNRSRCFANANYQTDAISIIDCRKRSFELQIRCTYVISVLCNSMWPEIWEQKARGRKNSKLRKEHYKIYLIKRFEFFFILSKTHCGCKLAESTYSTYDPRVSMSYKTQTKYVLLL